MALSPSRVQREVVMADRQRPFIDLLSPEIHMRLSSGMEKGPSRTGAVRGGSENGTARFDANADRVGTLSSNLTFTVYHADHREARMRADGSSAPAWVFTMGQT
jgi:hypothetical protein